MFLFLLLRDYREFFGFYIRLAISIVFYIIWTQSRSILSTNEFILSYCLVWLLIDILIPYNLQILRNFIFRDIFTLLSVFQWQILFHIVHLLLTFLRWWRDWVFCLYPRTTKIWAQIVLFIVSHYSIIYFFEHIPLLRINGWSCHLRIWLISRFVFWSE